MVSLAAVGAGLLLGLGLIEVFALAFGGFACAAMLWSRGISEILSKSGISKFAMRLMTTGLIASCAILGLNFVWKFSQPDHRTLG